LAGGVPAEKGTRGWGKTMGLSAEETSQPPIKYKEQSIRGKNLIFWRGNLGGGKKKS